MYEYTVDGSHPLPLVMCHFPIARWKRRHYGALHVYGHTHGLYKNGPRSMDVGVDALDYYPIALEEVVNMLNKDPIPNERRGYRQ